MGPSNERHFFASDNTAPICPEAWLAMERAQSGDAASYGDDDWSAQLSQRVCEIFETDCRSFLVYNGTAANALALAQLCRSFHSIICHERAHIETDECGAPEFFSGSKLLLVREDGDLTPANGRAGKIWIDEAELVLARQPELHAPKPRVISLTQATELGTVYTKSELRSLKSFADRHSLMVHMDGARFANAVAFLDCRPKEITSEAGVDVLCFGGTKNGLGAGELVVFFKKELASEFEYRVKQGGQLGAKMRFLAAPWLALLTDGVWLRNARHANQAARRLADLVKTRTRLEVALPVEANSVFVRMDEKVSGALQQSGWHFYKFVEPDIYRFMCSWEVTDQQINDFGSDIIAAAKA